MRIKEKHMHIKKLSLVLLFLGLIFGQLLIFTFNLNNGFEFHKTIFRLLPIADYSGTGSQESYLSSNILGYLFFLVFAIVNLNKSKWPSTFKASLLFLLIVLVVTFFELTSIIQDMNNLYSGKYFRIAWLLFLLGIWIYSKKEYRKK
ncbi:MAG: hypothetical protein MI739_11370 [Bacteroidales bacterium]|nr:hypothetical protein [Bacteroidales bacterium]